MFIYKNKSGEIVGKSNCHMVIEGATEYEATDEDIAKYDAIGQISELRIRREEECFSVINRGKPWYNRLTEEQNNDIEIWYQQWLDVTETKIIPERPSWLE